MRAEQQRLGVCGARVSVSKLRSFMEQHAQQPGAEAGGAGAGAAGAAPAGETTAAVPSVPEPGSAFVSAKDLFSNAPSLSPSRQASATKKASASDKRAQKLDA